MKQNYAAKAHGRLTHKEQRLAMHSFGYLVVSLGVMFTILLTFEPMKTVKLKERKVSVASKQSQPPRRRGSDLSSDSAYESRVAAAKPVASSGATAVKPSGDAQAQLEAALALIDDGKSQDALALLLRLYKEDPKNETILTEIAMIYLIDMKDPKSSQRYLEEALRVNPNSQVALSELLSMYEGGGAGEQGLAFLQQLFREYPTNTNLALGIGQLLNSKDAYAKAIPFLEAAAESGQPDIVTELADAYAESGQPQLAVDSYRRAFRIEQDRLDSSGSKEERALQEEKLAAAGSNLLAELFMQNRFDDAEAVLKELRNVVGNEEVLTSMIRQLENRRM